MSVILQRYSLYILIFVWTYNIAEAQTCCSAGAPLVSTNGIATSDAKQLVLHLDYNYTSINRLVSENQSLQNDPRTRNANTALFRTDYTINQNWALGLSIPFRNQNRTTTSENQSSSGLGDIILLGQYTIPDIFKGYQLRFATGFKLPTGTTENMDSRNIFLSPDMQSGTGTFDFITSTSIIKRRISDTKFNAQLGFLYRVNTTNPKFGAANGSDGREFKFGNELQLDFSLNYELLLGTTFVVPNIDFTYRTTAANQEQGVRAFNSGGNWLSSTVGVFFLPNEKFSQRIYFGMPLAQNLEGLQITTDFEFGIELAYRFNLAQDDLIITIPTPF